MALLNIVNPNFEMQLEQTDCCECGVVFALPKRILDERRRNKGGFYCPNGHSLHYGETELDRTKKRLDAALARENEERQHKLEAQRRADRLAAEAARQKKRASAGLCSCCNRTFANLARHMAAKHKDKA